jgi:predicted DNA-binding transcriptional regulator AlpA
MVDDDPRPPAYCSKATLARQLDAAESTVDELVRKAILPPPIKLSSGCVRWIWADVVTALGSLKGTARDSGDPYLAAVRGEQTSEKTKQKRG